LNAQSLWAGEEYAFVNAKPRGSFVMNARKGRVIRVWKQKEMFKENKTAYVQLEELDKETGDVLRLVEIKARDVIDFWTDFENERNGILKEREAEQAAKLAKYEQQRLEREERERVAREAREAKERQDQVQRERLINGLVEKGVPRDLILSISQDYVSLSRTGLELWLSIKPPQDENSLDSH
jgi:multidrug efflux pump subunit AcrA (membrane-fusion protein)